MNTPINRTPLPTVLCTETKKGTWVGNSYDHGATFKVTEDAGVTTLHIMVTMQDKNKEGKPLVTKAGTPWFRGWLRSMRIGIAIFRGEDGYRVNLDR
jgi:hypothetical protein